MTPEQQTRYEELIIADLTDTLSSSEAVELAELKNKDASKYADLEKALGLTLSSTIQSQGLSAMPESLKQKLLQDGRQVLSSQKQQQKAEFQEPLSVVQIRQQPQIANSKANTAWLGWSGWLLAACIATAFVIYALQPQQTKEIEKVVVKTEYIQLQPPPKIEPKIPTISEVRETLLANKARIFSDKAKPNMPKGEVVWDQKQQKGVMTLSGFAVNDRTKKQYQLWIVDKGRKQPEPVDGGVFNVDSDGTATVAINAALPIRDAKLFAVTEEQMGGVVVSENGKKGKFVVVMAKNDD